MNNPKELNIVFKRNMADNLINTPERLSTLIHLLINKGILNKDDIKQIFEDDI
jgi:polyhydroxyalkanoate synthesis regulator phasin